MGRPGQKRINMPMAISLPPDLIEEFDKMAGSGYGARSTLFRKMFGYYSGRTKNPAEREFQQERARRLAAEQALRDIDAVLNLVKKPKK